MQPAGFETATLGMHECIPYEFIRRFPIPCTASKDVTLQNA